MYLIFFACAGWIITSYALTDNTTDLFSAYSYNEGLSEWSLLSPESRLDMQTGTNASFVMYIKLAIVYTPSGGLNTTDRLSFNRTLPLWLTNAAFYTTVANRPEDFSIRNACPLGDCSSLDDCKPIYSCLYQVGVGMDKRYPFWVRDFLLCLRGKKLIPRLQCGLKIADLSRTRSPLDRDSFCGLNQAWNPGTDQWKNASTDQNLQVFVAGGSDTSGLWWSGWDQSLPFTEQLGLQLLSDSVDWTCRLNNPCAFSIDCLNVGAHRLQFGGTRNVAQTRWGYFALRSIKNIHLHFTNYFQALQSAAIKATLEVFNIERFNPPSNPKKLTPGNILNQLSIGFALASGVTTTRLVTGTKELIAPLSLFFISHAKEATPAALVAQQEFALYLRAIYTLYEESLQNMTAELFLGHQINSGQDAFNISDMLQGGRWVNPTQLEDLTIIEERIRIEVMSRSINALWREPANSTTNKMWLTFVDLQDGTEHKKCMKHSRGPQRLKYCADGGVYYAYNFIEEGDHLGKLGMPWGADQLESVGINPNASARTYRALQSRSSDPFNFSDISTLSYSIESPPDSVQLDTRQEYGRFPGSWTLPVCDISAHGEDWNVDYMQPNAQIDPNLFFPGASSSNNVPHPPCLCGVAGNETKGWVKAAGLQNFDTFYNRCQHILLDTGFTWPIGLNRVDYGFGKAIIRPR